MVSENHVTMWYSSLQVRASKVCDKETQMKPSRSIGKQTFKMNIQTGLISPEIVRENLLHISALDTSDHLWHSIVYKRIFMTLPLPHNECSLCISSCPLPPPLYNQDGLTPTLMM